MKFSNLVVLSLIAQTSAFAPVPPFSLSGGVNERFAPSTRQYSPLATVVDGSRGVGANARKTELLNEIEERAAKIEARTRALKEQIAAAEKEQTQLEKQARRASSFLSREKTGSISSSSGLGASASNGSTGLPTLVVGGVAAAAGVRSVLQNRAEKQEELRRQEEELARARAAAAANSNAGLLNMGPNKWPMGLVAATVPFFAFTNEIPSDATLQYNLDIAAPVTTRSVNAVPTNYVERYTFEEELVRRVAVRENEPLVSETADFQAVNEASIKDDMRSISDSSANFLAVEPDISPGTDGKRSSAEPNSSLLIAKAAPSTANDNTPLKFAQYAGGAVALLIAAAAVSAREDFMFEDIETSKTAKSSSEPSLKLSKQDKKISGMGSYFDLAVDVLNQTKPSSNGINNQKLEQDRIISVEREIATKLKEEVEDATKDKKVLKKDVSELSDKASASVSFDSVASDGEEISIFAAESLDEQASANEFEIDISDLNGTRGMPILVNGSREEKGKHSRDTEAIDSLKIKDELTKFVSLFIGHPIRIGSSLFFGEGTPILLLEKRKKENETSNIRVRLTKFASQKNQRHETGAKSILFSGRMIKEKPETGRSLDIKVHLTKFATLLYKSLPTSSV